MASDFRTLIPSQQITSDLFTSDAYGIPDIQGRDDSVRHQTLKSLQLYREKYPDRSPIPTLPKEQFDFIGIHSLAEFRLPPSEKEQLKKDIESRKAEFQKDTSVRLINLQNQLQVDYYSRMVEPGEKALFLGGRDHIADKGNTGEILKDRGYGTTTSIELRSNAEDTLGKLMPEKLLRPLDYTVMTEQGTIFDSQNKKVEMSPAPTNTPLPIQTQQNQNSMSVAH